MTAGGAFWTFFRADACAVDLSVATKNEVLAQLVDLLVSSDQIPAVSREGLLNALIEREKIGSTGIGGGVAIPHVKSDTVTETVTAVGVSKAPIEYAAVDGEPCNLFILLVSPKEKAEGHLQILRWLSKLVRDADFTRFMRAAKSPEDAVGLFKEMGGS